MKLPNGVISLRGLTDEEIYWEHGRLTSDGRIDYRYLTMKAAEELVKHFGQDWLDDYIAHAKGDVDKRHIH